MIPSRSLLPALLVVALAPALATAQNTAPMTGFTPTSDYVLTLDGTTDPSAEVYVLGQGTAYLVISDRLASPVLLEPRAGVARSLSLLKVAKRPNGTIDLLPQAAIADLGRFTIDLEGVSFAVDGRTAQLETKPPYLGSAGADELLAYSVDYEREAAAYVCSEPILRDLRSQARAVEVRVFFGSWCPHCQQVMPRILKVAQELAGSQIALAFYGLPRDIASDPEARSFDISAVPTGVVLVGGREVGRIGGGDWKIPELAIKNALAATS
ncbi:MAG: thioredoxin family protein [Thermoanaerobaculia bacterium]